MADRILVAEEEEQVRSVLRSLLARAGYEVTEVETGRQAIRELFASPPDLVILDLMLPEPDGWRLLGRIREVTDVPILVLSAFGSPTDVTRGLRAGADDYIRKPFNNQELVARVGALLRRAGRRPSHAAPSGYVDDFVRIDFVEHSVVRHGEEVHLSPLEFRLLAALVLHPSELLTHERLVELVWGDAHGASRQSLTVYVKYLRHRLGLEGKPGEPIETVRGFGYRYRAPRPGTARGHSGRPVPFENREDPTLHGAPLGVAPHDADKAAQAPENG
jgi:DNA-binding response OmpR family regulator